MHGPALVALALSLLVADLADAGIAARCRRVCRSAVDACVASGGRHRPCRHALVRACKRSGFIACEVTPPTTIPPTTSTTIVTVTSTTLATSTSTTIPAIPSYAGSWSFYGTLSSNACGLDASYSVTATVAISQSGTALTGRLGTYTLHGAVTADGFYLDTGVFSDPEFPGCYGDVRIEADGTGTRVYAALGIGVQCDGVTCVVVYTGSLSR